MGSLAGSFGEKGFCPNSGALETREYPFFAAVTITKSPTVGVKAAAAKLNLRQTDIRQHFDLRQAERSENIVVAEKGITPEVESCRQVNRVRQFQLYKHAAPTPRLLVPCVTFLTNEAVNFFRRREQSFTRANQRNVINFLRD